MRDDASSEGSGRAASRMPSGWHYPVGTGIWVVGIVLFLLGVYPAVVRSPMRIVLLVTALALAAAPASASRAPARRAPWSWGILLVRFAAIFVSVLIVWSLTGQPR